MPATLPASNDTIGWVTLPLKKYPNFIGSSTRKEFWLLQLIYLALGTISFLAVMQGDDVNASEPAASFGRAKFS